MKRLLTGVLVAALLLSQTSIADVFVKTDAATVTAAEQDAESVIETEENVEVRDTELGANTSNSNVGRGTSENEDNIEDVAPGEETDTENETPDSPMDDSEEEKQDSPEDDSK